MLLLQGQGSLRGRRRQRSFLPVVPVLLCCLFWHGGVQGADRRGDAETAWIEALSACVVYLDDDSSNKYITGTLFFSSGPVIVTNYHVLSSSTDTLHGYLATEKGVERFLCVFVKGDRKNDLAAFRIRLNGRTMERLDPGKTVAADAAPPAGDRYLTEEDFADLSRLRRGDAVIFLGFPLGYGLTGEGGTLVKEPLFRSGRVASGIVRDEFLIDAMVSNGNSGSPVFVRSTEKSGTQYRLAGVIKQYQHDIIKVRLNGRMTGIPHNTGIGIAVPADIVRDFLKEVPQ